jgi:PAS domain S-box-containing protein
VPIMLNSLRYRLLGWFLIFSLLIACVIIPANIILNRKEDKINSVVKEINSLHIDFLKMFRLSDDFFYSESFNPRFFITGESDILNQHQVLTNSVGEKIAKINGTNAWKSFKHDNELSQVTAEFKDYCIIYDTLVYLIYKKGYKNFGLEGEMIDYINRLENNSKISKARILQIRRNEKDYFLRNDEFYIENFDRLSQNLKSSIATNNRFSYSERSLITSILDNYINVFHLLVKVDKQIGIKDNSGLWFDLRQKCTVIESLLVQLENKSVNTQQALLRKTSIYYAIFIGFVILLSVVVSYVLSKHLVSHLETLTSYISNLTKHNFRYIDKINLRNSATEIRQIYKEFRNMIAQLRVWEKQRDTAIKNAEDNELRYRELADMLPQSIYETDELGNFTYVNKAWHKTFGYTNEDLDEGLNLIEIIITKSSNELLGHHKIENSNFIAIRKNGSKFPASVYSDNIIKGNRFCGRRGIIIDITARNQYISALKKETYKAQTADKLKSSFLANMSHEIRTPMNSIIGFSNLLSSEEIPENQKTEFASYIKSSGELLLKLIDDIIDIAKIEAGEIKIDKKECNILKMFQELQHTFKEIINKSSKKHLRIIFNPPDIKDLIIKTDPYRLKQILGNLINNAIKFTDAGHIEFGYKIPNEKTIEFFVKDTGIGLTRDEISIIFERFKRAVASEEKNIVGTGLGLAISKNLVELLGGEMWVDSHPGLGTTFYFTLPYLKITRIDEQFSYDDDIFHDYGWENITILVVEDDNNSYSLLKETLKKTKANIIRAKNGEIAIDICKSNLNIDIVLMDIQLPQMNGYEATREIKKFRKSMPVIAQTAFAMAGDKEKSIMAGCDDYISKPININKLLPKINQFLEKARTLTQPANNKDIDTTVIKNKTSHESFTDS